jgi:aryl-alcohol dehydrogenase-like predicted oxidoreductase
MKKKILGRTGLEVSELALGAAFVSAGDEGYLGAAGVVHEALDKGVNLIDTSADYGDSEAAVGEAFKERQRPYILSTKIGPRSGVDFNPRDKKQLRKTVEESLEFLHRDYIDILMIHEPDRPGELDWWADLRNYTGPVTELFHELKEEKLVRFTGLGGTTAYEIVPIIATGQFDVVLTAFNSSMLWREAEIELIPEAKRQNMGILRASPTQQGWLVKRWDGYLNLNDSRWLNKPRREQLKELYKLVDEIDLPMAELSLRWVLMHAEESIVLTGPRNIPQLHQNLKAMEDGPLPEDVVKRIDEIAAMVPFRPYEEPFLCPFFDKEYDIKKKPGPAIR